MAWLSGKHLIWLAAAMLLACAILHSLAWGRTQASFPPDARRMAALLWFLLAIDWVVFAILWSLGAGVGPAARPLLLVSLAVPIAVAIGLVMTLGPGFFAIYLQLAAAGLLLIGTLRLA